MKKAQLTMFIILGIVIVAVFGFVFFASTQIQGQQASQQAEQIVSQILETTSLKFYINLCAEKALEEGTDILSKQGGRIFPGQLGSILKNTEKVFSYKDEGRNKTYVVAYGVLNDTNTPPPQYPCRIGYDDYNLAPAYCKYSLTLPDGSVNPKFNNLQFGILNMPSLCTTPAAGCSFREGWDASFSVQSQLENHISEYVKGCVDLGSIIGVNETYNVTEGNVTANIIFSDDDITATIKFPVIVRPLIGQPVINLVSFQTSVQTRFKVLYGLAREAAANDVSSPTAPNFEFVSGFNEILRRRFGSAASSGFELQKFDDVTGKDNFIRIIDKTIVSGRELVLQFLEENRPPVLNYLDLARSVDTPCGSYDVVQLEGTNLTINPKAFDTEEDAITYSFNGWLYNYSENVTAVKNEATGCPETTSRKKSNLYQVDLQRRLRPNATGYSSVKLTEEDIGPHNLTVKVCDSQYCDFQIIRILVDDLLKININATNPFKTRLFSVEDPYNLTAKINNLYLDTGNYGYKWFIYDGVNEIYSNTSASRVLNLPLRDYTINNIVSKNNASLANTLSFGKAYRVLSVVTQGIQSVSSPDFIMTPVRCIAFTNPNSPYPYPYNNTDAFLSSHLCCQPGTNIYEDTNKKCYTPNPTYGSYNSFDLNRYSKPNDPSYQTQYQGFSGNANPDILKAAASAGQINPNTNDIIKREFYRNCDGKRGNICNGTITQIYSVYQECTDKAQGEIATCFGPPVELLNPPEIEVISGSNPPQCISYGLGTPTTFEKLINPNTVTDIRCSGQQRCVSSNNAGDVNQLTNTANTVKFVCNLTCGPNGCTRAYQSSCVNCYDRQTCSGPTQRTEGQSNTLTNVVEFDGNACLNSPSQCRYKPVTTKQDVCLKTITPSASQDWLIDFRCLTPQEKSDSNVPYQQIQYNCSYYNEDEATDTDGNNINAIGSCTAKTKSVCGNGACLEPATQQPLFDDKFQVSPGNYVYREYFKGNSYGDPSKLESCKFTDYDFDLYSTLCTQEEFTWWGTAPTTQRKCCGDDDGESWTGTQCVVS